MVADYNCGREIVSFSELEVLQGDLILLFVEKTYNRGSKSGFRVIFFSPLKDSFLSVCICDNPFLSICDKQLV